MYFFCNKCLHLKETKRVHVFIVCPVSSSMHSRFICYLTTHLNMVFCSNIIRCCRICYSSVSCTVFHICVHFVFFIVLARTFNIRHLIWLDKLPHLKWLWMNVYSNFFTSDFWSSIDFALLCSAKKGTLRRITSCSADELRFVDPSRALCWRVIIGENQSTITCWFLSFDLMNSN